MPLITFPNTFAAGTRAKASQVNANFSIINTWLAAGNIEQSYLAAFTGPITWNITSTAAKALSIAQATNETSIEITESGLLAASKAPIKIVDSANQTAGLAELYIETQGVTNSIPNILIKAAGSGAYLKATDSSSIMQYELKKVGATVQQDVASGSYHNFMVNGVSKARVKSTGLEVDDDVDLLSTGKLQWANDVYLTRTDSDTVKIVGASAGALQFSNHGNPKLQATAAGLELSGGITGRFFPNGITNAGLSGSFGAKTLAAHDVTNNVSRPIVVAEPDSSAGFKIISGTCDTAGGSTGTGFSVVFTSFGANECRYAITFSPAFSSPPIVVAVAENSTGTPTTRVQGISGSAAEIRSFFPASPIHFIAIGKI